MSETMQFADISRIKGILGNAKAIMNKVENNDYTKGNIDERALTEDGVMGLIDEGKVQSKKSTAPYTKEEVMSSNLPQIVKEAMLKNPIAQPNMNHTFTLEDLKYNENDEREKPVITKKREPIREVAKPTVNSGNLITIDKDELNQLIHENLMSFFVNHYNKTITEQVVNRTIKTLLKENTIVKKKISG